MFSTTNCKGEFVLSNNSKAARMKEKRHIAWPSVEDSLKTAALLPQQRGEMISYALQELLTSIPAAGTALIWPCQDRQVLWKLYYAGMRRQTMRHWLSPPLEPSLPVLTPLFNHDP